MRVSPRSSFDPRRPTTSRATSYTSTVSSSSHTREPVPIPGTPIDEPPPPLPPPRCIEELNRGIDTAWSWSNSHLNGGLKKELAPVKPGSSLFGGYMQIHGDTRRSSETDDMEVDDWDRRASAGLATRARSTSHIFVGAGGANTHHQNEKIPSMVRRPPSPNLSGQRLHGEKPLAQKDFSRSSQAYDQSLLSKIGKPSSPPHQRTDSVDTIPGTHKLSLQTTNPDQHRLTVSDMSSTSIESSRWMTSPISGGLSPLPRPAWREYNMNPRSPSGDSISNLLVLDPELFLQSKTTSHPQTGSARSTNEDSISIESRSQRGSYDQAMFGTDELDCGNDDLGSLPHRVRRQQSGQGLKRRALSPPGDMSRGEKSPTFSNDQFNKATAHVASRSPATSYRPYPSHGSISSVSSSLRQNSHASSFAPSLAGSSMTSISSYDRPSPSESSQAQLFSTPAGSISSPTASVASFRKPLAPTEQSFPQDSVAILRKMSIQTAVNDNGPPPATKIGNYYMCECCPKKPRKFETETELRAHQMEKQYACLYCNNRFKNKNEAERHQNSLHLRRHSWSCAAIPNYQAVFHPSSSPASQGPNGPFADACGFCGTDFPNHPAPDWDQRIEHLTTVHKFGECNQAKKFYRADHFRQHLKHTHGGQSGKWTTVLESVCLREESPQDASGISPTGSEGGLGRGPTSLPSAADTPMGGITIDEARDET